MRRNGARLILLVLLLATCIPIGLYVTGGGANSSGGGNTEIGELTAPDEDPIVEDDEAMDIVVDMLPGSDYGDILDFSLSYNEGGWIYEGTIQGKEALYSYQVDGENGNILKWIVVKK